MVRIDIPVGAKYIIDKLNSAGFEAYIVGGCVRDSILGKNPNDWDITTSATPYEVKDIFRRTIDTGIQHGTVTVLVDKSVFNHMEQNSGLDGDRIEDTRKNTHYDYAFEVTTYRVDGEYEDHRRPNSVEFTTSLEEDLKRRDFTINAMAYNDREGIIDIFGGIEDLKRGVIRCVGSPADRFDEDALRILRAVRFAAQLGFEIHEDTKVAMREQAKFLKDISAERIQVELTKLITSDNPDRLIEAYELGLTRIILPEFDEMMSTPQNNPYHLYSVGVHTIKVMENVPAEMVLRYSALLHDVAKPMTKTTGEDGVDHFYNHQPEGAKLARKILRRLKLDNNTIDRTCNLVLNHDFYLDSESQAPAFRRFLGRLGEDNFSDYMILRKADMAGQSDYMLEIKEASTKVLETLYQRAISEKQCIKISDLALKGKDLMELGMKPGKDMGDMLHYLLERVLEEPELNTREKLTALVQEKIKL